MGLWRSGGRGAGDIGVYHGFIKGYRVGRGLTGSVRIGRSQPTLWGHASRDPRQGLARGPGPLRPPIGRERSNMGAGRAVWVKIRASDTERAAWHAKARAAGLSLSDLVRRSVGRVRTWTVAHTEAGARADPGAGADRLEPEPDRPLGEYLPGGRRCAGSGRASGRHRAGAGGSDRRWGARAMMIKFLARGTGSACGCGGLPHP